MTSHGQWVARTPRGRIVATGDTLREVVLELLPNMNPRPRNVTIRWEGEPEPCLTGPWEPKTSPSPPDVSPKTTTG